MRPAVDLLWWCCSFRSKNSATLFSMFLAETGNRMSASCATCCSMVCQSEKSAWKFQNARGIPRDASSASKTCASHRRAASNSPFSAGQDGRLIRESITSLGFRKGITTTTLKPASCKAEIYVSANRHMRGSLRTINGAVPNSCSTISRKLFLSSCLSPSGNLVRLTGCQVDQLTPKDCISSSL